MPVSSMKNFKHKYSATSALRQSGIADRGVSWQQARGSVWHGQVTGLSWRGTQLGAVNLDSDLLRPVK